MRRFYPDMRRVAFISDNTYGGLSMQALVKKEMKKYPDLETIWLDGRTETFMEVSERMRRLPQNTCVLLGTWRVDLSLIHISHMCTQVHCIVRETDSILTLLFPADYCSLFFLVVQKSAQTYP